MNTQTTEREEALGAIIAAYNQVTDRLKDAHERLQQEVRRLREELERKNEELRRRERLAALGEMAAGLAHEVRNPLGGIALQASMLEGDLGDRPRCREAAKLIREGVRCLDRLVSDVLGFAQECVLETAEVDVGSLLARVGAMTNAPGSAEVCAHVDADMPALVADGARLERALLNLSRNAAQAAGPNGHVRLMARRGPDNGVEIEVIDDGPGIDPRHMERLFNPFFTTKADGTGLGLAIVHRIVEAHQGRIQAMNGAEGGARFVMWIPGGPRVASRRCA